MASISTNQFPAAASHESGISAFVAAAAITASAALWQQEGRTSIMLPLLAALILTSYRVKYRIERTNIRFICRIVLFAAVAIIYRIHAPAGNDSPFLDIFVMDQIGELCVAEIVIRAWSQYSGVKHNKSFVLLPIGFVFVIATSTSDDSIGRFFTPVLIVLLAIGIQSMRPIAVPDAARRARKGVGFAVAIAGLLGAALFYVLSANRDALTDWANRVLNSSALPLATTGLSEESHLGSTFGRSGSYDRVMRIHASGSADVSYMRAFSMYTYERSRWGPSLRNHERRFEPIRDVDLQSAEDGSLARVYRYSSAANMIFAPLNAVSIGIDGANHLEWAKEEGGPLRFDTPGPDYYTLTIGTSDQQGLVCVPPGPDHLQQLLTIPGDVNPKVTGLAKSITAGITDPLRKARAIEAYLPAHHAYSLRIKVSARDPLGDFLFSDKSAHCEFFASAAVVLMRCAGIPARYVIGYYAHEEEDGDIVVRQRDAHAWAECWIKDIGWVTIDATPGSGRPSGVAGSVPGWKRSLEKFQDWFANLRRKVTPENLLLFAGVFVCLALAAYLIQNRYHFKWTRVRRQHVKEYTASTAEIRNLYFRFETVCKKCGLICPPSVPWQEYLSVELQRASTGSSQTAAHGAATITAAIEFAAAYDLARFGRGFGPAGEYADLISKLDTLERDAKSVVTEEKST